MSAQPLPSCRKSMWRSNPYLFGVSKAGSNQCGNRNYAFSAERNSYGYGHPPFMGLSFGDISMCLRTIHSQDLQRQKNANMAIPPLHSTEWGETNMATQRRDPHSRGERNMPT